MHKDRSLETARNTLLGVLEGIAARPITDQEVERARTKLKNDVEQLLASSRSLAIALSEMIALGDWRLLFVYRDQLEKVQRADVQRVATEYLRPANRTLGLFHRRPSLRKSPIPRAPELDTLLANLSDANDVAAGEAFEPTPANIEARIIRQSLPSGMKLALLPKKTRGERVFAQLGLQWGDEASKANRNVACSLASAMLARGTLKQTRAELRDELDRLRAKVSVSVDGVSIETVRANLPDALRLAAEMLREPSFPMEEFEQVKRQMLVSIDTQRSDPQALASLSIGRHLSPYPPEHWNYSPTLDERAERLKAVRLEDAQRCHAELVGASHSDLAVVGDFDPDEITRLAGTLFGDWKNPAPYQRIPPVTST